MVHVAAYSDASYVRQLWDVHMKAAIDAALERQHGSSGGSNEGSATSAVALEAAAAEVGSLGSRLFPSTTRCASVLRATEVMICDMRGAQRHRDRH